MKYNIVDSDFCGTILIIATLLSLLTLIPILLRNFFLSHYIESMINKTVILSRKHVYGDA